MHERQHAFVWEKIKNPILMRQTKGCIHKKKTKMAKPGRRMHEIWHIFRLLSDFDSDLSGFQNSIFLKPQVRAERRFAAFQKQRAKLLKSRNLCHSEEISVHNIFISLALTPRLSPAPNLALTSLPKGTRMSAARDRSTSEP